MDDRAITRKQSKNAFKNGCLVQDGGAARRQTDAPGTHRQSHQNTKPRNTRTTESESAGGGCGGGGGGGGGVQKCVWGCGSERERYSRMVKSIT